MDPNPYESPGADKPLADTSPSPRKAIPDKLTFRCGAAAFSIVTLLDIGLAISGVFTVRSNTAKGLEVFAVLLNLPGIPCLLCLGGAPMGESHHTSQDTFNAVLFCGGGVIFWTVLAMGFGHLAHLSVSTKDQDRSGK